MMANDLASSIGQVLPQTDSIPYLTREQIKTNIALGQVLVLYRSFIFKLNSWLKTHPGGDLVILHFVGRDATDEIEAYHPEHVFKLMKPFIVGRVRPEDWEDHETGGWIPLNPPIQIGLWPMPNSNSSDLQSQSPDPKTSALDPEYTLDLKHNIDPSPVLHLTPNSRSPTDLKSPTIVGDRNSKDVPSDLDQRLKALEPSLDSPKEAALEGWDLSFTRQRHLSKSYRALHDQVRAAGLYRAPRSFYGYGPDLVRYTVLLSIFFLTSPIFPLLKYHLLGILSDAVHLEPPETPSTFRCFICALFLGLWWHQITFVAHDAGHSGITGHWMTDRLIGALVANFLNGMSIGWWCDHHDVHHLVTNHPEHDPDIQHLPFFAISTIFFNSLRSTYHKHTMRFNNMAKIVVKQQHRLYYFIMMFGRFNLMFNSYVHLAKTKQQRLRNLEIIGIVFFWASFGTLLYLLPSNPIRAMFVFVSFAVTSPLHVQIVLSHFGQSTADLGLNECFAHRQIRTTMDVQCPPWLDFLHGGLHMQVTHHLFPRLPRHRLRLVSERFVQPWCQQEGLKYDSMGFVKGNSKVLGTLEEVAKQIKILRLVASTQVHGNVH